MLRKYVKIHLFIAGIVIFYAANNFIWLNQNLSPQGPDECMHLAISLRFLQAILSGQNLFYDCFVTASGHWPPLFHILSACINLFAGPSYVSSVMVNIIYLILLLYSICFIGLKLFNENVGISAALYISLYPIIFRYSRFFCLEFAATAMVSVCICLLVYSDQFRNSIFSFLLGIGLGLAMLTKWTIIFFIIGPLSYVLCQVVIANLKNKKFIKIKFFNVVVFFLTSLGIAAVWYFPKMPMVLNGLKLFISWSIGVCFHTSFTPVVHPFIKPGQRIFGQLYLLVNDQISILFFVIFLVGLFFLRKSENKLFLFLWYGIPYAVFSMLSFEEARFMMPALPVIALVTGAGFQRINKKWKNFAYLLVLFLGTAQFFYISYSSNRNQRIPFIPTPLGCVYVPYLPVTEHRSFSYGPPYKENWRVEDIAKAIGKNLGASSVNERGFLPFPIIGIACEDEYAEKSCIEHINEQSMAYYFTKETGIIHAKIMNFWGNKGGLDFITSLDKINCFVYIAKNNSWPEFDDLNKRIEKCMAQADIWLQFQKGTFLLKPASYKINDFLKEKVLINFKEFLSNKNHRFKLIDKILLPEGFYAYVYGLKFEPLFLQKDDTKFLFDFGRGRIYRDGREITAGFGIYTSVLSEQRWHDSRQASWDINKIRNDLIVATGKWLDLPIFQTWYIKLSNKGLIDLKIELSVNESVRLKEMQVNIMLDKQYVPVNEDFLGAFSKDEALPDKIGFSLSDLESICNKRDVLKADFLNSDDIILKYYNGTDQTIQPGIYKNYFKGQIKLE